ncbi:hypothetical protein SAMN04490193_2760 [Pseudomonas marginalis]|nr:hypothetical protein SAMN04490193_2760 [Pseudomonas marginalis]
MTKKKTPSSLLPPIVVPLLEPPVEGDIDGADGGVGLRHSENPLVVYLVNPKVAVTAGSIALLYWGNRNVPVASTPIREGDENLDLIPLTVPASRIVEYWANPVFGKLRRASDNESFTEELKLRVSLSRPGGRDPNDQLPGHQGLVCVIPALILLNGVSEADALIGIKIVIRHWLHMRPYDLIILVWGSQQVLHRVQPGEEGRDITLTVDYATISAAGNNPLTRVAFQVRDAGGNLPDEWARWSAVSLIDVHLNQIRPEAPWLAFPKSETEIDLGELGSWDVEIEAWITSAEISAYSHVTLIWAGTDSEGNSIPHTPTQVLSAQGLYRFDIPNASVVAIAEGTASVHLLFQKGTVEQPSKKLYLNITGEVFRWPAPTIDEDFGGHINPDIAATVRFPLQASWPGNGYLEVIFRVSSPDNTIEHRVGREVDDIEPTPSGDMLFTVHPNELLRFVGQLVEVFYAHTRPGGRPQESLRMQVIVGQLQRTMPPPIVDKVISGQLNPDDIGAYVKVFAPFTETKRGDWIRMYWIGPHARVEVPVQVAVDGDTTEHDIESFYVTNNLNSTVTAFYTLKRGDEMPRYSKITEVLVSRNSCPLSIDQSTMELNGVKLLQTYGLSTREVPQNTDVRTADGGAPGRYYISSNPLIASVDASGKVVGLRNGLVTITVEDGAGSTVFYPVRVSNVFVMILTPITDRLSFAQLSQWANAQGGIQLPGADNSAPISKAFDENFSNYHQFLRQISAGMDPRYRVRWQAPTRDGIVAGHYIRENGVLSAVAYLASDMAGFEGPAFTFVPT